MNRAAQTNHYRRVACGLLLLLVVGSVGIGLAIAYGLPEPYRQTNLHYVRDILIGRMGGDSWDAMKSALLAWRHGGEGLYGRTFFEGVKYQYPPTAIFVSALLEWAKAQGISPYLGLSYLCLAVLAVASATILERRLARQGVEPRHWVDRAALWAIVAALMLTFYPVAKSFTLGQIQLWLTTLFAVSLLSWISGRKALSGALLGLVCLIKPQLAVFLLWGLARREWRFALAMLGVGLVGGLASLAVFGWDDHVGYLHVLSYIGQRGESYFPNQSVNGLLNRLAGLGDPAFNNLEWRADGFPPMTSLVRYGTLLSSLGLLAFALLRRRSLSDADGVLDFCIMAMIGTIASPIAWEHHYGLMFPIFAVMVVQVWGRWDRTACLAACYLVATHYFPITKAFAATPFNFVQSYLFAAGVLMVALVHVSASAPAALKARNSSFDLRTPGGSAELEPAE